MPERACIQFDRYVQSIIIGYAKNRHQLLKRPVEVMVDAKRQNQSTVIGLPLVAGGAAYIFCTTRVKRIMLHLH